MSGSFKDDHILLSAELIQQSIDINMNSTVRVPGYQHCTVEKVSFLTVYQT
jgi:hypothetical protein